MDVLMMAHQLGGFLLTEYRRTRPWQLLFPVPGGHDLPPLAKVPGRISHEAIGHDIDERQYDMPGVPGAYGWY